MKNSDILVFVWVNDVEITRIISKYLIGLSIDERYTPRLDASKLSLTIDSDCGYVWNYLDTVRVQIVNRLNTNEVYNSGTYYVEYFEPTQSGKIGSYLVSATDESPDLFEESKDVTYTNLTILQVFTDIQNQLQLDNLFTNFTDNNVLPGTMDGVNNVFTANSYLDAMRSLALDFGFFLDIEGKDLYVSRIENGSTNLNSLIADIRRVISFKKVELLTDLFGEYIVEYANPSLTSESFTDNLAQNNKIADLRSDTYFNKNTSDRRVTGFRLNSYFNAFRYEISMVGKHDLKAGRIISLGSDFGSENEGFNIINRATHTVSNNYWQTDLETMPYFDLASNTYQPFRFKTIIYP